jgi:putative heme iron utilization protein
MSKRFLYAGITLTASTEQFKNSILSNLAFSVESREMYSMILLARTHARLEATMATMTSVDRLGFSLRLETGEGLKGARINFLHEVATPLETRKMLVEMVRQAEAVG